MATFQVDVDQEKVLCGGEWLGTAELVDRIRGMIETGDYRIGLVGNALEYLQKTISEVAEIRVKFLPDDLNRIEQGALQAGITVGALLRRAAQAYLSSEPRFDITTALEDNQPKESLANDLTISEFDDQPVPLTQPKSQPISIPRLDAALPMSLGPEPPNSTWNNSTNNETVFHAHPASHGSPHVEDAWFKKG